MKGRFENLLAMSLSLLIVHVRKIMKKLIVTLLVINITLISCANGQIEKKVHVDIKAIKSGLGYWETKDCKEVSNAAGLMLYLSYQSLTGADKFKEGNKTRADELASEGIVLGQLAADYATTFSFT